MNQDALAGRYLGSAMQHLVGDGIVRHEADSLYVERPRLEHLYNVKRTWLTISQLQSESRYLIPIPHLQWFGEDELRRLFPWCCFCNSVCQYLAQRHVRLRREGMRLVRETVTGNPRVVMSHSIEVYKQFLQELVDQHVERYDYGH